MSERWQSLSPSPWWRCKFPPWLMIARGPETELGGCLHAGKVTGGRRWWEEGRGHASAWNPLRWPSKHPRRSSRRFIWSRAEAALRWESDSPVIYYPTNPESGALRKSSTADCCWLDLSTSPLAARAVVFLFGESQWSHCVDISVELTSLISSFSHVLPS